MLKNYLIVTGQTLKIRVLFLFGKFLFENEDLYKNLLIKVTALEGLLY